MDDLTLSQIRAMQDELQARYKGKWLELKPENGHYSILWLMEELGEVVSIIKKRGDDAIMRDPAVRASFIEEMSDMLMYFQDALTCYDVSPSEFAAGYVAKHERNMKRDFLGEHSKFLNNAPRQDWTARKGEGEDHGDHP